MSVDKNVKMGADLANNKDYKNVIRAVEMCIRDRDKGNVKTVTRNVAT